VARLALLGSGACGLASPWIFGGPPPVVIAFALVWGVLVIADSPQFSAMAARYAPRDAVGTALALQNGLGFAVTIGSLQLIPRLADHSGWGPALLPLTLGPALGLLALSDPRRTRF
jgi:MFS family permease